MVKNTRKVKIKHMEDKITHLATYPKDFQKYKDLLEENNREISLMRSNLDFTSRRSPWLTYL